VIYAIKATSDQLSDGTTIKICWMEVIVLPFAHYGSDTIYYWENDVRKESKCEVFPRQEDCIASIYRISNSQNNNPLPQASVCLNSNGKPNQVINITNGVINIPQYLDDGHYVLHFNCPGKSN